jgi:type IV pilus assembly protein PilV
MRARGFTILESMIALAVILIGILAITQMQTTQVVASASSRQRVEASLLAQQVIEGLRAYATIPAGGGATAYADIANGSDAVTSSGVTYARAWTVETKTAPDHKVLAVTVSWSGGGKQETLTLTTIIGATDPALSGRLISGT